MKFKLSRRAGSFGRANFRPEYHGEENVPAADITVRFSANKRDLDMLWPMADKTKISDVIYDEKGNLLCPFISPLKIHRKPESVTFTCWDSPTKERDHLKFDLCRVKNIEIELKDKRNVFVKLMVQLHDDPEKHSARLRRLMDTERDFSLEATQEDFFDQTPEDEDEESDGQGSLDVTEEQDDDTDE